jgi:hypothetical protein
MPTVMGRVMRDWETLLVYNAAQVMVLTQTVSADVLEGHLQDALDSLGVSWLKASPVEVVIESQLHLTHQMNRPFRDDEPVLRPFVSGTHVGIVYRHWPLDSRCVRLVMRRWLERMFGFSTDSAPATQWNEPPVRVWATLLKSPGKVLQEYREARLQKTARRLESTPADGVRFVQHPSALEVAHLLESARANQLTLNELFLACTAVVCHRLFEPDSPKRTALAVGTIIDARDPAQSPLSSFGMMLSFVRTHFPIESLQSLRTAMKHVRDHRAVRTTLAESNWRLASLLRWTGRFDKDTKREFYRKRAASSGGISNVNMNKDDLGRYHPYVLADYYRVSPLGPSLPLVITPTTLGESMNIGISVRSDLFDLPKARHTLLDVVELLRGAS